MADADKMTEAELEELEEAYRLAYDTDFPPAGAHTAWRVKIAYAFPRLLAMARGNRIPGGELSDLVTAAMDWSGVEPSTSVLYRAIDAYRVKYRIADVPARAKAAPEDSAGHALRVVYLMVRSLRASSPPGKSHPFDRDVIRNEILDEVEARIGEMQDSESAAPKADEGVT